MFIHHRHQENVISETDQTKIILFY